MAKGKSNRFELRLEDFEIKKLDDLCEKTCRSRADIIRLLIMGYQVSEKPDDEFYTEMSKLDIVCANMNQIRKRLYESNYLNDELLKETILELRRLARELREKYIHVSEFDNVTPYIKEASE